jgi:hypothetical protein
MSEQKHMPRHTQNRKPVFHSAAWSYLLKYLGSIIYLLCLFVCHLFNKDVVRLHSVKWLGGSEQGNGKDFYPTIFLEEQKKATKNLSLVGILAEIRIGSLPNTVQSIIKY